MDEFFCEFCFPGCLSVSDNAFLDGRQSSAANLSLLDVFVHRPLALIAHLLLGTYLSAIAGTITVPFLLVENGYLERPA